MIIPIYGSLVFWLQVRSNGTPGLMGIFGAAVNQHTQ